eukprot:TRINITY_DN796_c0_g1_i1.p1 TRINITY_DN796_c0_g1~~TRINITY_DN796_c0_g1_i1.p1  ORF type:complete len:247 (-),score=73.22 TRINITY_DN796_c0_g1_i1:264-962(-)
MSTTTTATSSSNLLVLLLALLVALSLAVCDENTPVPTADFTCVGGVFVANQSVTIEDPSTAGVTITSVNLQVNGTLSIGGNTNLENSKVNATALIFLNGGVLRPAGSTRFSASECISYRGTLEIPTSSSLSLLNNPTEYFSAFGSSCTASGSGQFNAVITADPCYNVLTSYVNGSLALNTTRITDCNTPTPSGGGGGGDDGLSGGYIALIVISCILTCCGIMFGGYRGYNSY